MKKPKVKKPPGKKTKEKFNFIVKHKYIKQILVK